MYDGDVSAATIAVGVIVSLLNIIGIVIFVWLIKRRRSKEAPVVKAGQPVVQPGTPTGVQILPAYVDTYVEAGSSAPHSLNNSSIQPVAYIPSYESAPGTPGSLPTSITYSQAHVASLVA